MEPSFQLTPEDAVLCKRVAAPMQFVGIALLVFAILFGACAGTISVVSGLVGGQRQLTATGAFMMVFYLGLNIPMSVFLRASARAFAKVHDTGNARALGPALENLRRLYAFHRVLILITIAVAILGLFVMTGLAVYGATRAG
jgi:hypothetical protein